MADVRCPMCGKPNPEELEECQFCGARLKPVIASPSGDSQVNKPGVEPVKGNNSESEKIGLSRGAPIRPGEAPAGKNTAEPEQGLPSWLRTLRDEKLPAAGESIAMMEIASNTVTTTSEIQVASGSTQYSASIFSPTNESTAASP